MNIEKYYEIVDKNLQKYNLIRRPPRIDSRPENISEITYKLYTGKEKNIFWAIILGENNDKNARLEYVHYMGKLIEDEKLEKFKKIMEIENLILEITEYLNIKKPPDLNPITYKDYCYDEDQIEHYCIDYIDFPSPKPPYNLLNKEKRLIEAFNDYEKPKNEKSVLNISKGDKFYLVEILSAEWCLAISQKDPEIFGYVPLKIFKIIGWGRDLFK